MTLKRWQIDLLVSFLAVIESTCRAIRELLDSATAAAETER